MRIVITRNGKSMIKDIYPEVKYKKMISYSTKKYPVKRANLEDNNLNKTTRNRSFENNLSINTSKINNSNLYNNIDIDEVLTELKENSQNGPQVINLNMNNKKFNLPTSIAYRYLNDNNSTNDENQNKNLLPDVFVSINKKIEKEANEKGFNYIYDNIRSLSSSKKIEPDQNSSYKLPSLFPAYPLKYIINNESFKKINKEINEEDEKEKRGEQLTENNFRSHPKVYPKLRFGRSLRKEIKTVNTNLITYLNVSKDLHAPFVKRISKYNDEHLKKLNKISQKTMFNKGQENLIKGIIQRKIRGIYANTNEEFKEGLESIKNKLSNYDNIVKTEERKIIDKRERYINFHKETEKIWTKYNNFERFNKKGNNFGKLDEE